MHHWTSHLGPGRRSPPPVAKQGNILRLDLSIWCNFQQLWLSWQESLPSPVAKQGKIMKLSIHFMYFPATLVQLAEKPHPPYFCTFVRYPACVIHVEQPWSPYYKTRLRFLLSEFFLKVTNFVNFSKYSHREKYRTQDHGAGGRPVGSLTTIHTNIPAITITILDMELWKVISLLYVYACILLSRYIVSVYKIIDACCGSAGIFIDDHIMNDDMYKCVLIIRGDCGCAVALLWHKHAPSWGLAIDPTHPSYWQKPAKKVYNLLYTWLNILHFTIYILDFNQKCDVWNEMSGFKA